GEPGVETWEQDSWKEAGNANVWAPMSADEELGYVYLPVSTPTNDYYGGHRLGDGLYGDSLVCLDAATGKKVWHYQLVHHGLWDYDPPAAPNLIDIVVGGQPIKAVAQVTKQAFVYVFDRVTGKPVWPIEERPVPASKVPSESASKTQPFPTKPAPIDIQGLRDEDLIDLTPEPSESSYNLIGGAQFLLGPRGLPLLKPPFGSIVAIDMNTGEHRWRIPVGRSEALPPIQRLGIRERLGLPFRSWALVTKTVMIVVQMGAYGPPHFVPGLNMPIMEL